MRVSDVFESIHRIVKYFVAVDPLTFLDRSERCWLVIAWDRKIIELS